ncbi:MAG: glycosyltransferase family A protein [Anaerolineales bacterium]
MIFLTIFTAPKPFTNPHIAIIQRNAIQSWIRLGSDVEVFLVGEESGAAEVAAEFGVRYLPDVRRNQWGTPLVSSIFDLARQASQAPVLAYLNADIMVMPDFLKAARQVASQADKFLVIGRRWDLDVRQELDFSRDWVRRIRDEVKARGRLHGLAGSDYFIFPRPLLADMPDFAVGRAGWDNWVIYKAWSSGWIVIDATSSVMAIHQDHDYSHLPEMYTVLDTNKVLINGQIRNPGISLPRLLRRAEVMLMDGKRQGLRWFLLRRVRRLRRRVTGTF